MKSLKYSSMSKIKKQKQEERVQTSVLNTLKQDDEICTGLLDTLSEDYLGYLQELMGKKTVRQAKNTQKQTKLNQEKQTNLNQQKNHQRDPSIDLHIQVSSQINQLQPQSSQEKNQEKTIPFEGKEIETKSQVQDVTSSIVLLNVKSSQTVTLEQIKVQPQKKRKHQKKEKPLNQLPNKNQTNPIEISQVRHKIDKNVAKNEGKSKQDNNLIINIQGYLESLSNIKQKQEFKTRSKSQSKNQYKLIETRKDQKQSMSRAKNQFRSPQGIKQSGKNEKKMKERHSDKKIQKEDEQKIHYNIQGGNNRHYATEFSLRKKKPLQPEDGVSKYQSSEKSSSEGSQSDESQQQKGSNSKYMAVAAQNIRSFSKLYNRQQNKLLQRSGEQVKKGRIDALASKYQNEDSLEFLLINVITKYNKLLNTQNKYKTKVELLSRQIQRLKEENQQKDAQIYSLRQFNKWKSNNKSQDSFHRQTVDKHTKNQATDRPKKKYHNSINNDSNSRQQQTTLLKKQNYQQDLQKSILKNLDFRKKPNQQNGKAINIEKMFIIDNVELYKHKSKKHSNNEHTNQFEGSNEKEMLKLFLKKQNDKNSSIRNEKEKRSVSCRQTVRRNHQENSTNQFDERKSIEYRQDRQKYVNKNDDKKRNNRKQLSKINTFFEETPSQQNFPSRKGLKNPILYEGVQTYHQTINYRKQDDQPYEWNYSARKKSQPLHQQDRKIHNQQKVSKQQTKGFKQNLTVRQRNRDLNKSYNSVSLNRKQTRNNSKKDFINDRFQEKVQMVQFAVRDKLNQSQKSLSSGSQNDQQPKDFHTNMRIFSASTGLFKKHPLINHQESQSTDSELLEKLLSIQKSNHNPNSGKNYRNKTFFN